MSPADQQFHFSFKQKKFLANIDSLYASVHTEDTRDSEGNDPCMAVFREMMDAEKKAAREELELYVPFADHPYMSDVGKKFVMHGLSFNRYDYDLDKPERYRAFFMGYRMTSSTPTAIVQIRSEALWVDGVEKVLEEVYEDMKEFYAAFGMKVVEVKENRIDFAYHTNYIQNPTSYFRMDKIPKMQQSRFERWNLQGAFTSDNKADLDYFTMGRRKSNNLFFRVYNKTKEVIEQGYKQFFFHLWFKNGMISNYDLWCYEQAFVNVSRFGYKFLNIARLQYYLKYGTDEVVKEKVQRLIDPRKESLPHDKIKSLADELTPPITLILNVEIETKRKFHRTIDKGSAGLFKLDNSIEKPLRELHAKISNIRAYHDYLTCRNDDNKGVIRFINWKKDGMKKSDMPTSDFWRRLQMSKFVHGHVEDQEEIKLMRSYTENLNSDLIKRRIANGISTLSIYSKAKSLDDVTFLEEQEMKKSILSSTIEQDTLDFLSYLGENDMERLVDYKHKKLPALLNRASAYDMHGQFAANKTYLLLDKETGSVKADTDKS